MSDLHLFIFFDDIEEFVVSAKDRADCFVCVDEYYKGVKTYDPDDLIMSRLEQYPDDMHLEQTRMTAGELATLRRGVLAHSNVPGKYMKPPGVEV